MMALFSGMMLWSQTVAVWALAPIPQEGGGFNLTWIPLLVLLALVGLVLLVMWLFQRQTEEKEEEVSPEPETASAAYPGTTVAAAEASAPVAEAKAASPQLADDLTRIEGVGPKISALLQENGISTYEQLANTDVGVLQTILTDAQLKIAHPDTWPEQASLAAAGDWDGLASLQDSLKGGRRTS